MSLCYPKVALPGGGGIFQGCFGNIIFLFFFFLTSVTRSDYLNTYEFMDKLAENLAAKMKQVQAQL